MIDAEAKDSREGEEDQSDMDSDDEPIRRESKRQLDTVLDV